MQTGRNIMIEKHYDIDVGHAGGRDREGSLKISEAKKTEKLRKYSALGDKLYL